MNSIQKIIVGLTFVGFVSVAGWVLFFTSESATQPPPVGERRAITLDADANPDVDDDVMREAFRLVSGIGRTSATDAEIDQLADNLCTIAGLVDGPTEFLSEMLKVTADSGISPEKVGRVAGAAISWRCPQYRDLL